MKVYLKPRRIFYSRLGRNNDNMKMKSFFRSIVLGLNTLVVLSLLLACIIPYTASASLAFLSLAVPLLVLLNILFFLFWIVRGKTWFLLSLAVLVFGYFTLGSFIEFGTLTKKAEFQNNSELRIMSFNSLGFRGKEDEWKSRASEDILEFIKKESPDIICFQEFDHRKIRTDDFKDYPYKFVDFEFGTHSGRVIQAIYSKYEIIDSGNLLFPNSSNSAVFSDIIIKRDTLRFYNLHLESLNIRPNNIKTERSHLLFSRLRDSFAKQQEQARIVRKHRDASPYKTIVCGDFNTNQFSNAYFTIKGNLKDSFIEQGAGYGATINFWQFPFRIDFILVDPNLDVLTHDNYTINLSDHEPIIASIKVGK